MTPPGAQEPVCLHHLVEEGIAMQPKTDEVHAQDDVTAHADGVPAKVVEGDLESFGVCCAVDLQSEADVLPAHVEVSDAAIDTPECLTGRGGEATSAQQGHDLELAERLGSVRDVIDESRDEGTTPAARILGVGLAEVRRRGDALLCREDEEERGLTVGHRPLGCPQRSKCRSGARQTGKLGVSGDPSGHLVLDDTVDGPHLAQVVQRDVDDLVAETCDTGQLETRDPVDSGIPDALVDSAPRQGEG